MKKRAHYRIPYRQAVRHCFFVGDCFRAGSRSTPGDRIMHDSLCLILEGYWSVMRKR